MIELLDLVESYNMDAIHFDDYFYPYPLAGLEFSDNAAFLSEPRGFKSSQKEDWRRDNVDLIIRQLHDSIKAIKPLVEFGISPFGGWRNIDKDPLGSNTKAGITNYDHLQADILKWQKNGWIDYLETFLDDFTMNVNTYTHYHWTGEITLVKGRNNSKNMLYRTF